MIEKLTKPKPKRTPCVIDLNDLEEMSSSRKDILYCHDVEIYVDLTDAFLIYLNLVSGYTAPYLVKQFMFRSTVENCILVDAPFYVEMEEIAFLVSNYTLMFLGTLRDDLDSQQQDQAYTEYFEEMVYYASSVIDIAMSKVMGVLQPKQISIDNTIPAYWDSVVQYDLNADVIKEHEITLSETLILVTRK